ncbi:hypothetical protein E3T46_11820 [Cryobacterium sp. Hh11]|uniref:hypothetical protein n=1 Tax=Cryobacterium sp. Hh11 TaxID=2555868 RepID=UPI001069E6B5|nr:hypothetical protein [Cryobacterium sp. Hh11]TFD50027.1 hypothetical protein E3T46_11820 [Cryobacterium sp. Hh11]
MPEVAAIFDTASIALEVTGRRVIVLPGDLPVYRTLRVGVSGPDVLQLKQGLSVAGIEPGPLDSDVFNARTASAVTGLAAEGFVEITAVDGSPAVGDLVVVGR